MLIIHLQNGLAQCVDSCAIVGVTCGIGDKFSWPSQSGPRFRKHRRFIHQMFNQRASTEFRPLQEQETLVLLDNLIQTPGLFVQHLRRYFKIASAGAKVTSVFNRFAAATILTITYGHKVTSVDDLFVTLGNLFWKVIWHPCLIICSGTCRNAHNRIWYSCRFPRRFLSRIKVRFLIPAHIIFDMSPQAYSNVGAVF